MSEEHIVRYTIEQIQEKIANGKTSETDWAHIDALTDEDIERALRDDPDWADFIDVDWSKAVWVIPVIKKSLPTQEK